MHFSFLFFSETHFLRNPMKANLLQLPRKCDHVPTPHTLLLQHPFPRWCKEANCLAERATWAIAETRKTRYSSPYHNNLSYYIMLGERGPILAFLTLTFPWWPRRQLEASGGIVSVGWTSQIRRQRLRSPAYNAKLVEPHRGQYFCSFRLVDFFRGNKRSSVIENHVNFHIRFPKTLRGQTFKVEQPP